jgi:hypothetical protein
MRSFILLTVVLGAVLVGVASSRTTSAQAQAQHLQAGIADGERVGLAFDANGAARECTVIDVRGDFVGCRGEASNMQPGPERWYNLRFIARIDRLSR